MPTLMEMTITPYGNVFFLQTIVNGIHSGTFIMNVCNETYILLYPRVNISFVLKFTKGRCSMCNDGINVVF